MLSFYLSICGFPEVIFISHLFSRDWHFQNLITTKLDLQIPVQSVHMSSRDRHGRDRMVFGLNMRQAQPV